MSPQLVRYAKALGLLGLPLLECAFNQVHTAPPKKNSPEQNVERAFFQPSMARTQNTWQDTLDAIEDIIAADGNDRRRMPGSMKCGFCFAQPLCNAEQNGQNTDLMRRVNYKPNTYGYGKEEV
jgi:hypothetical protein